MTRLLLIRHGQTDDNLNRRYCGARNPSLNSKGVWEAEQLANRLKDAKVDKVFSSDLKRAYETAEIIFGRQKVEKTKDFREMNLGVFEGLQYEEIMKKYPELYSGWIDNPWEIKIPEGEGLKEVSQRVEKRLSAILSSHKGKTLAVVTHGGAARIILHKAKGSNRDDFWSIEQDNGTLNIIEYQQGVSTVIKMNDIAHLNEHII